MKIDGIGNTSASNDASKIADECVKLTSVKKFRSLINEMEMLARKRAAVEHGIGFLRLALPDDSRNTTEN